MIYEVAFKDLLVDPLRNGVYKPKEFHGHGTKVVNMKELFAYEQIGDQPQLRVQLTDSELSRFRLASGDLLFARRSFVLEGAGKCSLIGRPSEPTVFESSMIRARLNRAVANPSYMYYFFRSPLGRSLMATIATRTAVSGITGTSLSTLRLPVLPVEEQRVVVSVLAGLDDLIENNRQRIELLEQIAQAIYREWFVHFRYPGHEDDPLVDSPLGPIPEGWEVRPFSAIGSFLNGFAFKPAHWGGTGRPIIKIKELKQGVTSDTPRCPEEEIDRKYWVEAGDLLFSWSADIGAYRWSGEAGLLNQHLFTVVPSAGLSLAFLFHALEAATPQFWDRAQGTTMRHIKRAALSEVSTVVPSQDVVDAFTAALDPAHREVITLRRLSLQLAAIRDLLLPKLVTGQIDVSNLDLDAVVESVA